MKSFHQQDKAFLESNASGVVNLKVTRMEISDAPDSRVEEYDQVKASASEMVLSEAVT